MYPSRPPSRIRPKVSTMPRQTSEASHYLDIYKLTVEKRRLKRELEDLAKRQKRIQERLSLIDQQVATLEGSAQRLREPGNPSEPNSIIYPPSQASQPEEADDFGTMTLDY